MISSDRCFRVDQSEIALALIPTGRPQSLVLSTPMPQARLTEAMAIYRSSILAARVHAIRATFPTVGAIVGETMLTALAQDHAAWCAPASADLNTYGEHFGAFLAQHLRAASLPYLPDVAALDWAIHRARSAAGLPVMDLTAIAAALASPTFNADLAGLVLHPAALFVAASSPLASIWQRHQEDSTDDAWEIDWTAVEPVLVTRPQDVVLVQPITPGQAALVQACADGDVLTQAVGRALAVEHNLDMTKTLLHLTNCGAIAGVKEALR